MGHVFWGLILDKPTTTWSSDGWFYSLLEGFLLKYSLRLKNYAKYRSLKTRFRIKHICLAMAKNTVSWFVLLFRRFSRSRIHYVLL